jgi:hypothetical protein
MSSAEDELIKVLQQHRERLLGPAPPPVAPQVQWEDEQPEQDNPEADVV